jgi:hypothetical protein
MQNGEAWVKILYTYGPFAILVFLVFVTLGKSRRAMNDAASDSKKMLPVFVGVYVCNWLAIFFLVGFSLYAWKRLNLDRKPQISGTIENLLTSEILSTTSADLFLHKIPKSHSLSDYEWLLVNRDKRWNDGARIKFTIQTPRLNSRDDDLYEYELPIQSVFYDNGVRLRHRQDKLFLDNNGQEQELQGGLLPGNTGRSTGDTQPDAPTKPSWNLVPSAYAQMQQEQQPFSAFDYTVGLESPDASVRRKTRYDLALQDQSVVLPWIDGVLKDRKSSYRLRLGVLVALNNMPNLSAESLLPATVDAIQNSLNDLDDSLRNEALSLAKRYKLVPVTVYEHFNYSGKSQVYGPGKYCANKGQLGNLPNDSASSVRIAKGFRVRLCDDEGNGNGAGVCQAKGAGAYQLKWGAPGSVADKVSFIEVIALKKK